MTPRQENNIERSVGLLEAQNEALAENLSRLVDKFATAHETVQAMKAEQAKMKEDVAAAARLVADAETMRVKTFTMVHDMHKALMEPQMGHGEKPLLQRMAEVTVDIESGKRSADAVLYAARWLVAVAAFVAGIAAFVKFGIFPRE